MKLNRILGLVFATAMVGMSAQAGEYYQPAAPCAKQCCDDCGSNFYAFGFAGASFENELSGVVLPNTQFSMDLDDGLVIGGGVGLKSDFLGGFRFELEGFYGENEVSNVTVANIPRGAASGSVNTSGFHFNFIKEFRMGRLTPYAGIGIGLTNVDVQDLRYGGVTIDDSDVAFSWQAIAGIEACLTRNASIFVEYNYGSVGDFQLDRQTPGGSTVADIDEFTSHSLNAGLRFAF